MESCLKVAVVAGWCLSQMAASPASIGLSDPSIQKRFVRAVPNPLDPGFIYQHGETSRDNPFIVSVGAGTVTTGLVGFNGSTPLETTVWGYGVGSVYTWPGMTFEVYKDEQLFVHWKNNLPIGDGYLLTGKDNGALGNFHGKSVVDTSYHWCYTLENYLNYTIESHGTPIVPHLHGGHTQAEFDGNPEYFFTPEFGVKGPQWHSEVYEYENKQSSSMIWYHDHALGVTRLNVYAGMAGAYIIRDDMDTGKPDNPLKLPTFPYEVPLLVQDRMFKENGELFYPAFNGDPFYRDFITEEGAQVGDDDPSALAEFFGDFIVVNGVIWPKLEVEPRKYRLRFLNGCDSRFMVIEFVAVALDATDPSEGTTIPFQVIGGDQGLAETVVETTRIVFEPSGRYDIIMDFSTLSEQRIILKNTGGDEPFGGDIPGPQAFEHTDKVMAFDVVLPLDASVPDDFDAALVEVPSPMEEPSRVRKLALFEGHDQLGRLQPLLGTVGPATDKDGNVINWPDIETYRRAGLIGPMEGAMPWHAPTTENPNLGDTEDWEIWNVSADAHPIHVHLVNFHIISRRKIIYDSNANEEGEIESHEADHTPPAGDGSYSEDQPVVQHDGSMGHGYVLRNPTAGDLVNETELPEYLGNFPRDVVTALPGQVTTIRMKFEREGRFNWHCHILSHEDHEMMRIYHVGALPENQQTYSDRVNEGPGGGGDEGSNNNNIGAIVGGVGGAAIGAVLLVGLAVFISPQKPQKGTVKTTRSEQALHEKTKRSVAPPEGPHRFGSLEQVETLDESLC